LAACLFQEPDMDPSRPPPPPDLIPLPLAAHELGIRLDLARDWVFTHKLDGQKIWNTRWYATRESVDRALRDGVPDRRRLPRVRDERGRYVKATKGAASGAR